MADTTQPTEDAPAAHAGPPRRYLSRIALTLGLVGTGVVLVVTIGVRDPSSGGVPAAAPPSPSPSFVVQEQRPQPGVQVPRVGLAAPPDRPTVSDEAELETWARRVAGKTQIPQRLVAAYGRAEMWMTRQKPACHLSWATLAGIGHTNFGEIALTDSGDATPPVIGPATAADTDHGELDGDRRADHKVGPMQFLPATWSKYAERATSDGNPPNPQNIDDAAFTAARYLCSGGDDLGTPSGWWRAALFYDPAVDHAQTVFDAADAFAAASVSV
ncbi:murein transglycosylase [Amycolatopsis sp. PS_44_ISF1]|uniref:murein transglycosylase n=1 Tax=Amycolatopsis sp. PS_44_ISF1 TaxID=2974917 RepID=UPI0028DF6F6A|nr:murein transglycosylase [Amycolatopsis sp. PS_44_ISF1]MDT8911384.1 murein transglycosylase [Amycolatopsis sp. PS_44_ISF1]